MSEYNVGDNAGAINQQGQRVVGKQYNIGRVGDNAHLGDVYHITPQEVSFPVSNLPVRDPYFIGRVDELERLRQAEGTAVIAGLGGVGKSQLMLEFAHEVQVDFDIVWWLRVDVGLAEDFMALGRQLALPLQGMQQEAAVQLVRNWLSGSDKRWLLLLDAADATGAGALRPFLPASSNGRIVITSRSPRWQELGMVLSLDVFSGEETAEFWGRRLASTGSAAGEALDELAEEMGRLPLAMEHAAAYMLENGLNGVDYLALYKARRQALWKRAGQPDDYHATITTTWNIAFEKVSETPGAAELLNLCSFLAPNDIPLNLLVEHAGVLPEPLSAVLPDVVTRFDALSALEQHSLVSRKEGLLAIQRLVQVVARDRMEPDEAREWLEAVGRFFDVAFVFDENDVEMYGAARLLIPHLITLLDLASEYELITSREEAHLLHLVGKFRDKFGEFEGALAYFERALALYQAEPGGVELEIAAVMSDLGFLLAQWGQYERGRPYLEQALAVHERASGLDHLHTISTLNKLGILLRGMGYPREARVKIEQALKAGENLAESNQHYRLISLGTLAGILSDLGEVEEAERLNRQALEISKEALGPEHPDTIGILHNLAVLLLNRGAYEEARPYFEVVLAANKKLFGPNHPNIASTLMNLSVLHRRTGNLEAARATLEEGLAIHEQYLGDDHPVVATDLYELGEVLFSLGNLTAAKPIYERLLPVLENVRGYSDEQAAHILMVIGRAYRRFGDREWANPLVERAMSMRERLLGPDHIDTGRSYWVWGIILRERGEAQAAESYLRRAYDIHRRVLGPEHEATKALYEELRRRV